MQPARLSSENRKGALEVICGSMFSGKTEELIRRLRRAVIAKQRVEIFKPETDKRYDAASIVSHDDSRLQSTPVPSATSIPLLVKGADVVGIDEAQFFDDNLPAVCAQLADGGLRVIVAGLDLDYRGIPFGPMPRLLALADFVTKVHAICMHCGDLAHHSFRTDTGDELVVLGEKDRYIPLCRGCYNRAMAERPLNKGN
jgi:thymidine kinase